MWKKFIGLTCLFNGFVDVKGAEKSYSSLFAERFTLSCSGLLLRAPCLLPSMHARAMKQNCWRYYSSSTNLVCSILTFLVFKADSTDYQKSLWKYKWKKQWIFLSFSSLFVPLLMEIFATSGKLWNNIYGNWPITLWLMYFAAILFAGLQILFLYARASRRILNVDKKT